MINVTEEAISKLKKTKTKKKQQQKTKQNKTKKKKQFTLINGKMVERIGSSSYLCTRGSAVIHFTWTGSFVWNCSYLGLVGRRVV